MPPYTEALIKNGYNANLQFDKTCTTVYLKIIINIFLFIYIGLHHIYIYIYIYIYIHTLTHTHMVAFKSSGLSRNFLF